MNSEKTKPERSQNVLSESDLECVWAKAGVIASKVCDMDLDCEKCPLDLALRQGFRGPHEGSEVGALGPPTSAAVSELRLQRGEVGEKILNTFFHQLEQFCLREDR